MVIIHSYVSLPEGIWWESHVDLFFPLPRLDRKELDFFSYDPDGFCEQPETLPYNLSKRKAKKQKPSNVSLGSTCERCEIPLLVED